MDRVLTIGRRVAAGAAIAALLSGPALAGDPGKGAAVFHAQCGVCHAASAHAAPGVGPRLFGVLGRKAGTLPGYSYSPAMKKSGITWSEAELKLYLGNPGQTVHGNKMPYSGLRNPGQLEDLVAYLATLK